MHLKMKMCICKYSKELQVFLNTVLIDVSLVHDFGTYEQCLF